MDKIFKVFTSEIKSIDEKEGTLTAYISTSAKDRMDEVLDPSGVDLSHYKKNPVVLWAHDYSQPPIGKALWVKRDDVGIISKVKFASTAFAQEIYQLYKEGFLKAFSVGFIPKEVSDDDDRHNDGKKPKRTYKKWELLEYSAVPVPANPEALALSIQRGILKSEPLKKAIEAVMKYEDKEIEDDHWEGEEPEPKKETEEKKADPIVINPALDELIAANKLLQETIGAQHKQIAELRYAIYKLLHKEEIRLPEMTVDNLGSIAAEEINRVIRQMRGKVN